MRRQFRRRMARGTARDLIQCCRRTGFSIAGRRLRISYGGPRLSTRFRLWLSHATTRPQANCSPACSARRTAGCPLKMSAARRRPARRGAWWPARPQRFGRGRGQLGQFLRMVDPGLHFKLPLGVDVAAVVPVKRQLKQEFGFSTPDATNPYKNPANPMPKPRWSPAI